MPRRQLGLREEAGGTEHATTVLAVTVTLDAAYVTSGGIHSRGISHSAHSVSGGSICKAAGHTLPSIHSEADKAALKQIMGGASVVWIGAMKSSTGVWYWADGSAFDYTSWNGHSWVRDNPCAFMYSYGNWDSRECSKALRSVPVVCKI